MVVTKTKTREINIRRIKIIKLAVVVKKHMILFCNICENNEKTQFESMDKPFKIMEIIPFDKRIGFICYKWLKFYF